jgi:hypothetical protein
MIEALFAAAEPNAVIELAEHALASAMESGAPRRQALR